MDVSSGCAILDGQLGHDNEHCCGRKHALQGVRGRASAPGGEREGRSPLADEPHSSGEREREGRSPLAISAAFGQAGARGVKPTRNISRIWASRSARGEAASQDSNVLQLAAPQTVKRSRYDSSFPDRSAQPRRARGTASLGGAGEALFPRFETSRYLESVSGCGNFLAAREECFGLRACSVWRG